MILRTAGKFLRFVNGAHINRPNIKLDWSSTSNLSFDMNLQWILYINNKYLTASADDT